MLDREKRALLIRHKRKYYYFYPFFFIILWLSTNTIMDIIMITLGVIYVIVHQGYFIYEQSKLDGTDINF